MQPVTLRGPARRFVSRGGDKLDAALERFAVDPDGPRVPRRGRIDRGLHRSPAPGRGRPRDRGRRRLRTAGVVASNRRPGHRDGTVERPGPARPTTLPFVPSLVVADLSFISLRTVLPALVAVACARRVVRRAGEAAVRSRARRRGQRRRRRDARRVAPGARRGRRRSSDGRRSRRSGSWPRRSRARRATWSSCSMGDVGVDPVRLDDRLWMPRSPRASGSADEPRSGS